MWWHYGLALTSIFREKAYWDYLEERYTQYKQIQESIGYDQ